LAAERDRVAGHAVAAGPSEDLVVSGSGGGRAKAVARDPVIARPAVERVVVAAERQAAKVADVTAHRVAALSAVDQVVAESAYERVGPIQSTDAIVSTQAVDRVTRIRADDHVVARGSNDHPGTRDRRRLAKAPGNIGRK
jgi:hypothetical protein